MNETHNKIKIINNYLLKKFPNELKNDNFIYVCCLFNSELFGDIIDSEIVFNETLGLYGYSYNESPLYYEM